VIESGIFVGTLRHRRFSPVSHVFTYPVFMVLLDIDRIAELMQVSRVTSYNHWNWASFDDRDHLGHPGSTLRARLEADARLAGVPPPTGRIFLLTHLRYLGYCFNPVSFYYVLDNDDCVGRILAEVHNTFGGSHRYWLDPSPRSTRRTFQSAASKSLYVSPFMPVDLDYRFAFTPPTRHLTAHMTVTRTGHPLFDATLCLERRPWTAPEIRRQLCRQPAMTMRVITAIHWQALRLWWKGVPVVPRRTPDGVGERQGVLS
jgi:DUF1365 family protein